MIVYTDGSGGPYSGDPRLRRCGWSWVVDAANGCYSYALVAHYGEHGSMDGKQTVPRFGLTAVMRALLAVEHFGPGVTEVTLWPDSKIVVDGYRK
eukprot:4266971-Karenia_brevis.AAC.1